MTQDIEPSDALLWAMFASGALGCSNGNAIGQGRATTSEGRTIQAAKEADLLLTQFHERYMWRDDGWQRKTRTKK